MQSSVELLRRLKEQHDKRTVSVLVGAGFSKNAIPSYPDWDGLLRDLVLEVYGMKIKERYRQHKSLPGHTIRRKPSLQKKLAILFTR